MLNYRQFYFTLKIEIRKFEGKTINIRSLYIYIIYMLFLIGEIFIPNQNYDKVNHIPPL